MELGVVIPRGVDLLKRGDEIICPTSGEVFRFVKECEGVTSPTFRFVAKCSNHLGQDELQDFDVAFLRGAYALQLIRIRLLSERG